MLTRYQTIRRSPNHPQTQPQQNQNAWHQNSNRIRNNTRTEDHSPAQQQLQPTPHHQPLTHTIENPPYQPQQYPQQPAQTFSNQTSPANYHQAGQNRENVKETIAEVISAILPTIIKCMFTEDIGAKLNCIKELGTSLKFIDWLPI